MVGLGGLEPPTSSLSAKRSNRLSYRPVEQEILYPHLFSTTKSHGQTVFFCPLDALLGLLPHLSIFSVFLANLLPTPTLPGTEARKTF